MSNIVFIATSLDGYIADKQGSIDWLHAIPNPDNVDMGFGPLMSRIDAIVMGRNTFDIVRSFECDWPYPKPVCVLSNTLETVPEGYEDKIFLMKGTPEAILPQLHQQGLHNLYIDGGVTIQHFLQADCIDELIITTIPVLLGGGAPLFGDLANPLHFRLQKSEVFLDTIVQNHFVRQR